MLPSYLNCSAMVSVNYKNIVFSEYTDCLTNRGLPHKHYKVSLFRHWKANIRKHSMANKGYRRMFLCVHWAEESLKGNLC